MSERIHLSLDKDAQATLQKLEGIINNRYDGNKSKFFRDMLMNYDDQSRLRAKAEIIEQRIDRLENEIEDLKLQKKAVENEIEETSVEEPNDESDGLDPDLDREFWDRTIELIFKRRSKEDPASIEARFNEYFSGRKKLYNNKANNNMSRRQFLDKMFEEAEKRGYDEKLNKLKKKVKG